MKQSRYKSLYYLLKQDKDKTLLRYFFSRPFFLLYSWFFKKQPPLSIDRHYYFGLSSMEDLQKQLSSDNSLLLVGISYCMRPSFCKNVRFSDQCPSSANCQNCLFSQLFAYHKPLKCKVFIITTVYAYAKKILQIQNKYPHKQLFFLTMACDFSIRMFAELSSLLPIRGAAIAIEGNVCASMPAFLAAEDGKKQKNTCLDPFFQKQIISLLQSIKT